MKKIIFGMLLSGAIVFANVKNIEATPKFIKETKLKIIDIRTKGEWIETGIVKGSYTLTFFDKRGNYDVEAFLTKLDKIIDKNREFAIICRTGSRTGMISNFLGQKLDYKVVNLRGGIKKLSRLGFKLVPYKSAKNKI
jgi:rhodanese-related sulfurtransferase